MKKWNELPMTERQPYLKLGVELGIYSPSIIAERYNKMAEGGGGSDSYSTAPMAGGDSDPYAVPTYKGATALPEVLVTPKGTYLHNPYDKYKHTEKSESIGLTPFWADSSTFTEPIFDGLNARWSTHVKDDDVEYKILDRDSTAYLHSKATEIASKMQKEIQQKAINQLESLDKESLKRVQRELAEAGAYDQSLEGISKSKVKQIQRVLVKKGYLDNRRNSKGAYIEVDGIVGEKTLSAYNKYNRDKNVDGILGKKTIKAYLTFNNIGQTSYNREVSTLGIDGCAQWVTKKYESSVGNFSKQRGVTLNAWQMPQNIVNHGGEMIYNIYDESFNNVKDVGTLKKKTEKALKENPIDYSTLRLGDIVGIYMPSSNMHSTALRDGSTKNTHVGIVTGFDQDGMPIVEHNIHTSHRKDRADKLSGSLFGRAQIATVSRPALVGSDIQELPFESKPSRFKLNEDYNNELMQRYMDSMEGAAPIISEIFPDADIEEVMKASIGILKRETNFMTNRVSDQIARSPIARAKNAVRDAARFVLGRNPEDKSSDLTKFKLSTLNQEERKLLGINELSDLEIPEKAGLASIFTLAKNYDYFKRLQNTYPDLGITDDDILNLTILSYNQGMNKLYHIGFDPSTHEAAPQELETIRSLARRDAKIKDVSSTNYKYLNYLWEGAGDALYDIFGSLYTPYVSAGRAAIEDFVELK